MSNKKILFKDFSYPSVNDKNIQEKLYKKREFYYHKILPRDEMKSYDDIQNYRDQVCKGEFKLREQQAILSNLINPNTPYKGLLVMHGTGTGKSCTAISIAEQFKEQAKKYNTKIYILSFGPNGRETIKNELLVCTGNTYIKNKELFNQLSKDEIEREERIAINAALQNYKILSYKTFYKKVLGEKITEKNIIDDTKLTSKYKKTDEGEYEREIVAERINNMDNTLLIVDEAHNLTGNEYGEALKKIIKVSKNLRVILLTATPMKNLADNIIDLLNFIRPLDDQIQRDKIFYGESNYTMKLKPDGLKYLKEKANGYVSFFRGNIPYTFATKIDKGIIPKGLLFTPVIKCFMFPFQFETYKQTTLLFDDKLDKASSSAANFVFPGLNKDKNNIIGYHSNDGINIIINQLEIEGDKLRKLINNKLFNNKLPKNIEENFLYINDKKNITGSILNIDYLKFFSVKFYQAIININNLINDNVGIAFVYSNLVKAGGMEIFAEALIVNGYIEYQEDEKYNINDNTIDYYSGIKYKDFKDKNKFKPATFIVITGGTEDTIEDTQEIKQRYIRNIFNSEDNIDGKHIKLCLGSRVMNEGVTLENVKEIHILDVHYNLGKVDQVIGRGIRMCKHIKTINDENKFPQVNVYRYVVALLPNNSDINTKLTEKQLKNTELSTEEILYQKAELKYLLVKEIEHALKETALDCNLLLYGNIFPEEIKKYKNCKYPTLQNVENGSQICPAICDFRDCTLKCDNTIKPFDLENKDIDYNTFNDNLAKFEINNIKNSIKDLYRFKHVYIYNELLNEIKKTLNKHQIKLFDNYFLDKAIQELMPITENDFNNFKDTIYDKYNRPGYIIQRNIYYIFQPFNENEDVNMFYRTHIDIEHSNLVSIENYVKQKFGDVKIKPIIDAVRKTEKEGYNFDNVLEYYNERKENFIVGIIDRIYNEDIFKIREPRDFLIKTKKRGTGIPTLKGSVCFSSKTKEYLINALDKLLKINVKSPKTNNNKININQFKSASREIICDEIKNILLHLEKYSTTKDNNKITYVMIPDNHALYPFPYNLEDRIKHRIKLIKNIIGRNIDIFVKNNNNGSYTITFDDQSFINKDTLYTINCTLNNKKWTLDIA